MSRIKISTNSKAEKVSKKFPDEFKVLNKLLWWNLCKSYVNWEEKSNYASHRNGEKQKILANNLAKIPQSQKITNFTTDNENSWHGTSKSPKHFCNQILHHSIGY